MDVVSDVPLEALTQLAKTASLLQHEASVDIETAVEAASSATPDASALSALLTSFTGTALQTAIDLFNALKRSIAVWSAVPVKLVRRADNADASGVADDAASTAVSISTDASCCSSDAVFANCVNASSGTSETTSND